MNHLCYAYHILCVFLLNHVPHKSLCMCLSSYLHRLQIGYHRVSIYWVDPVCMTPETNRGVLFCCSPAETTLAAMWVYARVVPSGMLLRSSDMSRDMCLMAASEVVGSGMSTPLAAGEWRAWPQPRRMPTHPQ